MIRHASMTAALALTCLTSATFAEPAASFTSIGRIPGIATPTNSPGGLSADGKVLVGSISSPIKNAFRWTAVGGLELLGDLPGGGEESYGQDISASGSIMVGYGTGLSESLEGFARLSSGAFVPLGTLPGSGASIANAVDASGQVIVGSSGEAFRWTFLTGMQGLGDLPGGFFYSQARGISSDGSTIVGQSRSAAGFEGFYWTESEGMVGLGHLPGGDSYSIAQDASADGSVIVGTGTIIEGSRACRWVNGAGPIELDLAPELSGFVVISSVAAAVSDDGEIIVGHIHFEGEALPESFLWTEATGVRLIKDILTTDYGLDTSSVAISQAYCISADGTTIAGVFQDLASSGTTTWIATIPRPEPLVNDCPCDFNDSGTMNDDDFFAFLGCFFGPPAECN